MVSLSLALIPVGPVAARALRDSCFAQLGPADRCNAKGERLTSAAAMTLHDRASYHLLAERGPEDADDRLFPSKENRAILERALENGQSAPGVPAEIVNGTGDGACLSQRLPQRPREVAAQP